MRQSRSTDIIVHAAIATAQAQLVEQVGHARLVAGAAQVAWRHASGTRGSGRSSTACRVATSLTTHILALQVSCLLSGNLVLQVGDVLFGLGDVDADGEQLAAVVHRFLRLGNRVTLLKGLQGLDLLQKLVEQNQSLGRQRLVENLGVQVSSLNGHLDLLY